MVKWRQSIGTKSMRQLTLASGTFETYRKPTRRLNAHLNEPRYAQ